jgi:hypothetical protein
MKAKKEFEKIYDLMEMFDFDDLTDNEKELVRQTLSEEEYNTMRSTIKDTRSFFSKPDFPEEKKSPVKKIISYPVELYKVAAVILLLAGIGFIISRGRIESHDMKLASADTVFIEKTDTIIVAFTDTVERIKEKIIYKDALHTTTSAMSIVSLPESVPGKDDCLKQLCPDEIQRVTGLKGENDLSADKTLTDFIVPVR